MNAFEHLLLQKSEKFETYIINTVFNNVSYLLVLLRLNCEKCHNYLKLIQDICTDR